MSLRLTEINELLIVATSEETTDFAYVSLENVDELALESETSTEYRESILCGPSIV